MLIIKRIWNIREVIFWGYSFPFWISWLNILVLLCVLSYLWKKKMFCFQFLPKQGGLWYSEINCMISIKEKKLNIQRHQNTVIICLIFKELFWMHMIELATHYILSSFTLQMPWLIFLLRILENVNEIECYLEFFTIWVKLVF